MKMMAVSAIYPIILKAHAGATVFRYCCVNFAIVG